MTDDASHRALGLLAQAAMPQEIDEPITLGEARKRALRMLDQAEAERKPVQVKYCPYCGQEEVIRRTGIYVCLACRMAFMVSYSRQTRKL